MLQCKADCRNIGAKAIIVESATGHVPRIMAHFRPKCPIIAVVTDETVCKKLCLYWGIVPILCDEKRLLKKSQIKVKRKH